MLLKLISGLTFLNRSCVFDCSFIDYRWSVKGQVLTGFHACFLLILPKPNLGQESLMLGFVPILCSLCTDRSQFIDVRLDCWLIINSRCTSHCSSARPFGLVNCNIRIGDSRVRANQHTRFSERFLSRH